MTAIDSVLLAPDAEAATKLLTASPVASAQRARTIPANKRLANWRRTISMIARRSATPILLIGLWQLACSAEQIEAKRLIARDAGVAEEWVDIIYSPGVVSALEPSLDPALIALLEDQKNFFLKWGFIKEDFDVPSWIAHEPLAEARRQLVDDTG